MPVVCPCCGKELYLTTLYHEGDDEKFVLGYEYSACSNCKLKIDESMYELRKRQADLKFAIWEQKEAQKEYEKNLLMGVATDEDLTISIDDFELFVDIGTDNIRISITPNQLKAIKKSKKSEPIVLKVKND